MCPEGPVFFSPLVVECTFPSNSKSIPNPEIEMSPISRRYPCFPWRPAPHVRRVRPLASAEERVNRQPIQPSKSKPKAKRTTKAKSKKEAKTVTKSVVKDLTNSSTHEMTMVNDENKTPSPTESDGRRRSKRLSQHKS